MTKESFLRGAVILALASMISRVIGLVYMVALPRLIYDDGMGLYQLVKPIHYFAAVLAIAGMPVAISKLIAEEVAKGSRQGVKKVFWIGTLLMITTGGLVCAALVIGAPWFAQVFAQDLGVVQTIAILGPACFFLALSAALRGFFQGLQEMTPTAVSQVVDQVVRVAATIFLTLYLRPQGVEQAVTGIAWGFVLGEFCGWLTLVGFYMLRRDIAFGIRGSIPFKEGPKTKEIVGKLMTLATPAVVATILWPIMQLADSFLIPLRMQAAGFSADAIREGLGHMGMALTLSQFPNIVTVALATSLVPAISEAWALKSKKLAFRRSEEALRMALIFGIPSFAALYILAEPLGLVLFGYAQVGASLRILALGTLTLGLIQATTGILQGLGAMLIPVRNLCFGVLVKFALNYLFLAQPELGILGAAWSSTLSWAAVGVLNLGAVYRRVGPVIHWRYALAYPLFAAGGAALMMHFLGDTLALYLLQSIATLSALVLGLILYFLLLMIWGSLKERDVQLIPVLGKRLSSFLQDWGFLRS